MYNMFINICFFIIPPSGCCVSFRNQRYFVVYCLYCTTACLYALYVNCIYMKVTYGSPFDIGFSAYFLPITIIKYMFGYTDFHFLWYTFITFNCAGTGFITLGIFIWQFLLAMYGKTTFELFNKIRKPKQGWLEPARSVWGSYWMLNFIFPTGFKQVGNCVEWGVTKNV